MDAITEWFQDSKDYYVGVALYATLQNKKQRLLRQFNKGKTRRNMSALVAELRQFKNKPIPKPPTSKLKQKAPATQAVINKEVVRKQQTTESVQQEFKGFLIGDLPPELRVRYSRAYNLFIQMIELKFALNDLPPEAEKDALAIQTQIVTIEQERDLIWVSLNHWKIHKIILPISKDEFKNLSPVALLRKHAYLKTNISKINKRVDVLYTDLASCTDLHKQTLIENKINASEKRIHRHKNNLLKIEKLI